MTAAENGVTRVAVRVADCFLLAHDDFMRRTGQGRHVSQSIIELDRVPDPEQLRTALVRLVQKHPLLAGRLRRDWKTWLPYWEVPPPPARGLPLGLWRERGAPGALAEATETGDTMELFQQIMTEPLAVEGIEFKARLDVVEMRDGRGCVALSWSHLLIDGKGAELLLAEIGRLYDGVDEPCEVKEPIKPELTFKEKIQKTKAAVYRLEDLAKVGAPSLAGPRPRQGRGHYQVITLSPADSAKLTARVEGLAGALFPMTFYVACAARAHDRVFRQRGREPQGYVVSVPVQTRKRGARGPLFHNQVSIFFFSAVREALGSIEAAKAGRVLSDRARTNDAASLLDFHARGALAVQRRDLLVLPLAHRGLCTGDDDVWRRANHECLPLALPRDAAGDGLVFLRTGRAGEHHGDLAGGLPFRGRTAAVARADDGGFVR
jgi:hypothetical protein